jgi:hypothetical protein
VLRLATAAIVMLALRPAAYPSSPTVGVDACAGCHQDIARTWRSTAHARALTSLTRAEAASSACRSCHATGAAPAGRSDLPGVQCEACHGAGADYAPDDVMRDPPLARALGLRDLSTPALRAAACNRCHVRSTRLAPFDPEAAWRRIAH